MPCHEGLTCQRQDDFQVEEDLRCESVEIDESDGAERAAYYRCSRSALIGEFAVSAECKNDILQSARRTFQKMCADKDFVPGLLDGRILALASVLTVQDTAEEDGDDTKTWKPILDALQFEKMESKTGCSSQTARNRLCKVLENKDYMRFFLTGGHRYYNTLMAHAIAPEQAYQNLFNILYAFYVENLDCYYAEGTRAAEAFTAALCTRWEENEQPETILRLAPLSSGIRELFVNRPHYMAAVCDGLLWKIDQIAQGNFSALDEMDRWDVLLKRWYEKKSDEKKIQIRAKRKAARKTVDRKENIHPTYIWENNRITLEFPGLSLPEIQERPVLILYQGAREVYRKELSVFGNVLLWSTCQRTICLDGLSEIDWEADFDFSLSVESGGKQIYHSGEKLYRRYFCFSASSENETALARDAQWLCLIVPDSADLELDGEEDDWMERAAPYRLIELWAERIRGIRLNGGDLFQTIESKKAGITAYFRQNPVAGVTVLHDGEKLPVYAQEPELVVEVRSREETKNYQLMIDGHPEQLCAFIRGNGKNRVELRSMTNRPTLIQIKNILTKKTVFQQDFVWIPGFFYHFYQRRYLDTQTVASLEVCWTHRGEQMRQKNAISVVGNDGILWFNGLKLSFSMPRIKAELNGKNALRFPPDIWRGTLERAFLRLNVPKQLPVHVFLTEKELRPNASGCYEIGAELENLPRHTEEAVLWLAVGDQPYPEKRQITRIFFREKFLKEPVRYNPNMKTLSWIPQSAGFIGKEADASFSVTITGPKAFEKAGLDMKNRVLWSRFPGGEGVYTYTVLKKGETRVFLQSPDTVVAIGKFTVTIPPEERYKNSSLVLTEALCDGRKKEWVKIRQDGAVIDYIRFERMIRGKDGEMQPEYSGILYFHTASGWKEFSDRESEKFEKINPVFFVPEKDTLRIYLEDDAPLMLNVKAYRTSREKMGVQIFSRKDELTKQEQPQYLVFADKFHYEEKESDAADE